MKPGQGAEKSATPASTTNYPLNQAALEADLEFPIAPDFISRPPQIEFHAMLRRIEENMPRRNARPGEEQRRLAEKVSVEFVL